MKTIVKFLVVPSILVSGSVHAETCSMEGYDSFPPRQLSGSVQSTSTPFAYGSDLDTRGGQRIIWNYVTNQHASNDLSLAWERADIIIPYFSPLPAGETFCNDFYANDVGDEDIDESAVIIFGNANQTKKAAVYGKTQLASASPGYSVSRIKSAFRAENGEIIPIDVQFFYSVDEGRLSDMGIINRSDFYSGIFNAGGFWSNATFAALDRAALEVGAEIEMRPWVDFAKVDTEGQFNFIKQQKYDSPIIKGTVKGFAVGERVRGFTNATLVVFDSAQRPIASGRISVPTTAEQ